MIYKNIPKGGEYNKYFALKKVGGFFEGIPGNKQLYPGSSLNNCVAAAWGLFALAENNPKCRVGCGTRNKAMPFNAGEWIVQNGGYDTGLTPKEGSIIVYGGTGTAGHVAYVNNINEDGTLDLLESNYGSSNKAGITKRTVSPENMYFISKIAGKCIGFIYPKVIVPIKNETPTKDITTIANEVLAGKWGVYPERKGRLIASGYDYSMVQRKVNEIIAKRDNISLVARQVINGLWGNGLERKNRLTKAGYNYGEVQKEVNKLLKK